MGKERRNNLIRNVNILYERLRKVTNRDGRFSKKLAQIPNPSSKSQQKKHKVLLGRHKERLTMEKGWQKKETGLEKLD